MIIENDFQNREIWSRVVRFWYSKTADKSLKIDHLYHHFVIFIYSCILQEILYYAKFLICELSFKNVRNNIVKHFNSIFNNKIMTFEFFVFETELIKTHEILFTNDALNKFHVIVREIVEGMFDNYIKRISAQFKKQSIYAVETCIAVMFEYELMNSSTSSESLFRLSYVEAEKIQVEKLTQTPQSNNRENSENIENMIFVNFINLNLIISENIISFKNIILYMFKLTFDVFQIALQRVNDKNVFFFVHVFLIFL